MIRRATKDDIPALVKIFQAAKAYMRENGNLTQWDDDYPECMLEQDLQQGQLYVLCDELGEIHATFVFALGEDSSYKVIDGKWLNDRPYGTIHRIASDGKQRGIFEECLAFCKNICPDIRADTHANNRTMCHLLGKHGFTLCGKINLDRQVGDTLRVAYQYEESQTKE